MNTVKINTNDRELYAMLALWLSDEGTDITDSDRAELTVIDTESFPSLPSAGKTLTVGGENSELPRPFSQLAFIEAVRAMFNGKKTRFRVDAPRRRIYHNRTHITLTEKEFAVFRLLYDGIGSPVSRDAISSVACGGDHETNAADVYICMLRRKLTRLFGENVIKTVRGCGYELILS